MTNDHSRGNNIAKAVTQAGEHLEGRLLRCRYIIALLLGHTSSEAAIRSAGFIKTDIPYTLPRLTVVSPGILNNLIKSEVIVGTANLKWSTDFKGAVRRGALDDGKTMDEQEIIKRVVELLGEEISVLVHFSCTGPLGYTSDVNKVDHKKDKGAGDSSANCNWYPKPQATHPVVLIGSPGTSKSAVMLTGLTTFYSNAASIGASIAFDSPVDESLMKDYDERYWAGAKPKPNPVHERLSIKLSVVTPFSPSSPTNFVFTDVPGQVASRSLTEAGPDPIVLNILNNAETIVFFFDLSIENTIREKLTQGDQNGVWTHVTKNFDCVKRDRPDLNAKKDSKKEPENGLESPSEAVVSQLQLLQKLLNDLRLARTEEELKRVNFICVIPKSDLFVQDGHMEKRGDKKQYFFTTFYEFLEKEDILVKSRQRDGESFIGKYSLAGSGSKVMIGDDKSEILAADPSGQTKPISSKSNDRMVEQHRLLRGISEKALECLQNIGNAIEDELDLRPLRKSLSDTVQVRLVEMLHSIFDERNVYFLPVSALGEEREATDQKTTKPFNQKLSEYVFAIPVILSSLKEGAKRP